jgi:hypothetical protein
MVRHKTQFSKELRRSNEIIGITALLQTVLWIDSIVRLSFNSDRSRIASA